MAAPAMRHMGGGVPEKTTSIREIDENWFMRYDADKDGKISEKELRVAIREKGGWWLQLFSRWYSAHCMAVADKNRDGYIQGDELNSLIEFAGKHAIG